MAIQAVTHTFACLADTELQQANPTTNYGNATTISCFASATVAKRGLLSFDISGIGLSAQISACSLYLYTTNVTSASSLSIHRNTQSAWVEDEATWNQYDSKTNWTAPGGDYTTPTNTTSINATGWKTISITSAATDALSSRSGVIHLLIKYTTESSDRSITFASSDDSTNLRRPYVEVTYVPDRAILHSGGANVFVPRFNGGIPWIPAENLR